MTTEQVTIKDPTPHDLSVALAVVTRQRDELLDIVKRAAHVMADAADRISPSDDLRHRIDGARRNAVEKIKEIDPAFYGLKKGRSA